MKKLIALLSTTVALISLPVIANAASATLPSFDVKLNTQTVDSAYREYPLLVYKDITYFPMTYYDCRYLGLATDWDATTSTLTIAKSGINCAYRDYSTANKNSLNLTPDVCTFNIKVNGEVIDNSKEEYPLLTYRDIVYFPLTWRFAAEEFDWDYTFDSKEGLAITSDAYPSEIITLPYLSGSAATDGKYYYYNGLKDNNEVVYRLADDLTGEPEVIFTLPDSNLSNSVIFREDNDEIYFTVTVGTSPVMSSQRVYKICDDGTVIEEAPSNYSDNSKYGVTKTINQDGISITIKHFATGEVSEFTYEKDGKSVTVDELYGRRIQFKRNGVSISGSKIQVFKDKIYYSAVDRPPVQEGDYYDSENSSLYVIDTATGEDRKLIDNVCGFHVTAGYAKDLSQNTTMIIYDNNGSIMRYSEADGNSIILDEATDENLILKTVTGTHNVFALLQTAAGDKTVVKTLTPREIDNQSAGVYHLSYRKSGKELLRGYAYGTILETTTGVYHTEKDNNLIVVLNGESGQDSIRTMVLGDDIFFYSSDVAQSDFSYPELSNLFLYDKTILYPLGNKIVKVNVE